MDFGSHSENAMSDFQTDKDRPLSDAYYRDYVEKRNEYGVSYTYGIISVNPKDYATKADKQARNNMFATLEELKKRYKF